MNHLAADQDGARHPRPPPPGTDIRRRTDRRLLVPQREGRAWTWTTSPSRSGSRRTRAMTSPTAPATSSGATVNWGPACAASCCCCGTRTETDGQHRYLLQKHLDRVHRSRRHLGRCRSTRARQHLRRGPARGAARRRPLPRMHHHTVHDDHGGWFADNPDVSDVKDRFQPTARPRPASRPAMPGSIRAEIDDLKEQGALHPGLRCQLGHGTPLAGGQGGGGRLCTWCACTRSTLVPYARLEAYRTDDEGGAGPARTWPRLTERATSLPCTAG